MDTLYDLDDTFTKRKFTFPVLDNLLSQQKDSIEKAKQYYQVNGSAVNSNHPIVKLLYSFTFPKGDDLLDIFSNASDNSSQLASSVGITTAINKKNPFEGVFYPGCLEYLVLDDRLTINDVFNLDDLDYGLNWMDLEPVKVLYHPYRLLHQHLPTGGSGGNQYAVISVDVAMLAVMYIKWNTINRLLPEGSRAGIEHFVGRFVLPGMLYSQADCTLLNMIGNQVGLDRYDMYDKRSSFFTVEYEGRIERFISKALLKIQTDDITPKDFIAMFSNSKCNGSLLDAAPYINDGETLANYTVRFLAWLGYVENTLLWLPHNKYLTAMHNRYRRIERNVKNRGVLTGLPSGIRKNVTGMYERIGLMLE